MRRSSVFVLPMMLYWLSVFGTGGLWTAPCQAESPYPDSPVFGGLQLDWKTHQRFAQGSDNFQLTWADDDQLYGAWGDGGGFGGSNRQGRVGLGVARVHGMPPHHRGTNAWGGYRPENRASFDGKSWGMLCVDKKLYMWVVPDEPIGKAYRNHYEYVELARSHDHGATWTKADWKFLQSEMLSIPTFLNFGRNYTGVPSAWQGYVYSYFISPGSPTIEQHGPDGVGLIVHRPGRVYLARVAVAELFEAKSSYQFFTGRDQDGQPRWGPLAEKQAVFEDPDGVGWCLSAVYHPATKRVILTTEHGQSKQGQLGLFDAPAPWGPWTTIEYFERERPFGSAREGSDFPWRNNVFFASFPTKWMDGTAFTLCFTGAGQGRDNDSFNTVGGRFDILRGP